MERNPRRTVTDLKTLVDTPPWEWPGDAGKMFHKALTDRQASEADRLTAAELAGDSVVINDELANDLLAVVSDATESEQMRAKAVISFGPALESAWTGEFDDPYDPPPITERMFRKIQDSLETLYFDNSTPKLVRRRILEASVRAPEPWHQDAIRDAYASGDAEWVLTAVFAMQHVRGFDEQILESLNSADPEVHYQAVEAAGNWSLDAAWPHVADLVTDEDTPKELRLAAIEALGSIRPSEAGEILAELADSEDEEIAEAANDAMMMAEAASEHEEDEDDEDEEDEDEEDEEDDLVH
jgi:hypothetical protein